MRAERLHQQNDSWSTSRLHGQCCAHRCHSICSKSWVLLPETITNCIKTLLILQSPGGFQRFRDFMMREVGARLLVLRNHTLTPAAENYRAHCLRMFAPSERRSRARATALEVANKVFNGDWRLPVVAHLCRDCCVSPEESRSLAMKWLPKLLLALRFKVLSRSDWLQWEEAINIIGWLSSMHRLFGTVFIRAFSNLEGQDVGAAHRDEEAEGDAEADIPPWRAELNQNVRAALSFWRSKPEPSLHLLRTALDGQRSLMRSLLEMTSLEWEAEQLDACRSTGSN